MRQLRDESCAQGKIETAKVNFNLACAVHAYANLTAIEVPESFRVTGLYPFQRPFAEEFRKESDDIEKMQQYEKNRTVQAGVASRVQAVRWRNSDGDTYERILRVMEGKTGTSTKLKELSKILRKAESLTKILEETMPCAEPAPSETTATGTNNARVLHDAGASAQWVTLGALLENRRQQVEAEKKERLEREKRRERAARARRTSWLSFGCEWAQETGARGGKNCPRRKKGNDLKRPLMHKEQRMDWLVIKLFPWKHGRRQ